MVTTFVPTRYLSFSYTDDGTMVLFNSLTGAIGALPVDQATRAREALQRPARHKSPLEGVLDDLREGGFLVPEGTDEQAIAKQQFLTRYHEDYLNLHILPTEQCNFRCVYCYESFLRGSMSEEIRDGIKRYVERQKSVRTLEISWFGGEPLYAADVVTDLSRFFTEHCSTHGISHLASMTTNGYLLTPEVADEIIPLGVRSFQITLDGLAEEHDKRRILQNGGSTFERILTNLRYLKNSNHAFTVMLRHNFDQQTATKLEDFIAMLKTEFGDDPRFYTHFFAIGQWGGANDPELAVCDAKSGLDALLYGRRLAAEAGLSNASTFGNFRPNGYVCYAAHPKSFVVGSDGQLYKCTVELDYHDRNIVGHLRPDGTMELDWRKMGLWCETNGMEMGEDTKCSRCFFSPTCHGAVCPKSWMETGDVECPPEKVGIRKVLPLILQESQLPQPPNVRQGAQCLK